jgi:hypothetical protein
MNRMVKCAILFAALFPFRIPMQAGVGRARQHSEARNCLIFIVPLVMKIHLQT